MPTPDLREFISLADLVVIASPFNTTNIGDLGEGERVRVERVLKGKFSSRHLTVAAGVGNCPEGIGPWTSPKRVLFLFKPRDKDDGWHASHCGIKPLPIEKGFVMVDGKLAPLQAFAKEYGMR